MSFGGKPECFSTSAVSALRGRRGRGRANPVVKRHPDALNIFDDSYELPPSHTPGPGLLAPIVQRRGRCRLSVNQESEETEEFPSKGVKHIEPVERIERKRGLRVVDFPLTNNCQSVAVVGSELDATVKALQQASKMQGGIPLRDHDSASMRPASASIPLIDVLIPRPQPESEHKSPLRPPNLSAPSAAQRVREAVRRYIYCHRGLHLASFFAKLCRGAYESSVKTSLELCSPAGTHVPVRALTVRSLRDQLSRLILIPLSDVVVAEACCASKHDSSDLPEGELKAGDCIVTFEDFVKAFGADETKIL